MSNLPWPPSPDSLGPMSRLAAEPRGPAAVTRRQHLELAAIMGRIAALIDSPASYQTAPDWRSRLLSETETLVALMEDHRDMEESHLFPALLERDPEIAPVLDELGDDHVRIFEEWNRLQHALAIEEDPPGGPAPASIAVPLRAFVEHLWRHTLGEEKLFDRVFGSDR